MKQQALIFSFIVFTCSTVYFSGPVFGADMAKVTRVKGAVSVEFPTGEKKTAELGMSIPEGSVVITGIKSSATFTFLGTITTVQSLSKIKVAKMTAENVQLKLKRGALRARLKQIEGTRTSFSVRTPVATASVRGSELEMSNGPGMGTESEMLTGNGGIEDNSGNERELDAGESSSVLSDAEAPETEFQSDSEDSYVMVAPPDMTADEAQAVMDSGEISFETPADNPIDFVDEFINAANKATVNVNIVFP